MLLSVFEKRGLPVISGELIWELSSKSYILMGSIKVFLNLKK
jgi:hypothetical protein